MTVDFDSAEARLGASTRSRLANATATVGTTAVEGVLDRRPVDAALGSANMQARAITFVCDTAELVAAGDLARGASVAIDYAGASATYTVELRTDLDELGQTELELAAA